MKVKVIRSNVTSQERKWLQQSESNDKHQSESDDKHQSESG